MNKLLIATGIFLALFLSAFVPFGQAKQVFGWVIADRLTVLSDGTYLLETARSNN